MQHPSEGEIVRGYGKVAIVWTVNHLGIVLVHANGLFHSPHPVDGDYIGYEIITEKDLTPEETKQIEMARSNLESMKNQRTKIGK